MQHIFYVLLLIPIMYELIVLYNTKKIHAKVKKMKGSNRKWDQMTDNEKLLSVTTLMYLLITFFGLFTFQWYLFLFLILTTLIPKKSSITFRFIDSLIGMLILIFAIVNKYHLRIDLIDLIK